MSCRLARIDRAPEHSLSHYVCELGRRPSSWGVVSATIVLGFWSGAILAVAGLALVTWIAAGHPRMRRYLDAERAVRLRRSRQDRRETRLEEANVRRAGLEHVTALAAALREWDPETARLVDLDQLLDHYADTAIALELTKRVRFGPRDLTIPWWHEQARAVRLRRIAFWQRCQQQEQRLGEQLATIVVLLRALLVRAANRSADGLART